MNFWPSDARDLSALASAALAFTGLVYNGWKQSRTAVKTELREQFVSDYIEPIIALLDMARGAQLALVTIDPLSPKVGAVARVDRVRELRLLPPLLHTHAICQEAGRQYGHVLRKSFRVLLVLSYIDPAPVHKYRLNELLELFDGVAQASSSWRQLFADPGLTRSQIESVRLELDESLFKFDRAVRAYLSDLCTGITLGKSRAGLI